MNLKLFYMGAVSGMSGEQIQYAENFINNCGYGFIATNNKETGARLSALGNVSKQTFSEMYFATDIKSQKIMNIQENPHCELMYTDGDSQIMVSGNAKVLTDIETKKAKWNDMMLEHFPDGPEGDAYCVIKFTPETVRAMLT